MRVLYWTPLFWPSVGGTEILAARILPALQARGHEFVVVTSRAGFAVADRTTFNGSAVHRFPFTEALARRDLRHIIDVRQRIGALKRAFRPDLVHLHHAGPTAYFHVSTLRAHAAPTLLTIHTPCTAGNGHADTVFGQTLRLASWVTAVSNATLADVIDCCPDLRPRSSVIYNGFDAPATRPAPLPFNPPTVLYVGRLSPEKGVDLALDAFVTIGRRAPGARLTIAGDGPARRELERQADTLGLGAAVTFLGWVPPDRVPALMNAATLVVVPSRYREPFGMVVVEAGQMARPVVAARTGGLEETVIDGETGLLFEPGNRQALADAVSGLLASPAAAARLGQAGRRQALDRFGLAACVAAYDCLYRRLGSDAAASPPG